MIPYLAAHSYYSLLEAVPSPVEYVQAAQAAGIPTLALTDHRRLTGAVEFQTACKKAGIQPIIGLKLDVRWQNFTGKVILLNAGVKGWSNLCRISSALMLSEHEEEPLSLGLLAAHAEDLICLSSAQDDADGRRLGDLQVIYPGRLFTALHQMDDGFSALRGAAVARRLGLPTAAVHPMFAMNPIQMQLLKTMTAIRKLCAIKNLAERDVPPTSALWMEPQALKARFYAQPEAIRGAFEIAERCRGAEIPVGIPNLPRIAIPNGLTPIEYLRCMAEDGARKIYGVITSSIQARLDHELDVIAKRGFEPIFLIVQELLQFARSRQIPTASRGSASSSLVAHCLGITTPDPLALDLYFERFLNPARVTPPDIDTDIDSTGRDEVIQHVFDVYGAERVSMVCTINRYRPRSALGDVAKAHGLSSEQARELVNTLPYSFWAKREAEAAPGKSPFIELRSRFPQYRAIFDEANALLNIPRHISVHPGGLVVAPDLMTDLAPVMRSGQKGVTITQLDLESIEELGLVKIDLLGIRGLTVLGDVAGAIQSWRCSEYKSRLDVLDDIPADDTETSETLMNGRTIGCFQIESPGMRAILREIKAKRQDDLIAALALYRPGPLQGGLKDAFVRRFKGEEPVTHIHPALAPLLESTFGVILYQEQVLRIAHELAGLSLAEADLLRRAMSHFDPGRQMQLLQQRFIRQVEERSGIPQETAARLWEMMAAFAGYGFPKAHAASYAQVGWRSAWCKTHFPAEFMAAVLANWGGYYSQRVYVNEARRLKLKLRAPQVNHARKQFSVGYPDGEPVLFMGLDQVRDLTHRTIERIIHERPFASLQDFLAKVDPRREEAENLARVGAMGEWGTIPALLRQIGEGGWRAGQMNLFGVNSGQEEDWTLQQRVDAQNQILGISLEAHPLEIVADQIKRTGAITTIEAVEQIGHKVTVAGIRQTSHRSMTARGEAMMFLTLEDLEGTLDVIFFPDVYRKVKTVLGGNAPIIVHGTMETEADRDEPILRAETVELLVKA